MTKVLEMLHLAKENSVAQVKIGAVGSKPAFTRSGLSSF